VMDAVSQLPALTGSQPSTNSGAVSAGGGTNGQAILTLRNLGANRTLVLLDGHRMGQTNPNGTSDVNLVPQSLIAHVDVITGGASATYGADAVAGAVNFVLNHHFQGFKAQIDGGETQYGDGKNGHATAEVKFSSPTAVYKGLAIAKADGRDFLYASNFHDGTVDVFNARFKLVHLEGHFRDRNLPPGYAPFGIQELHGLLYVTYALQNAAKHDDVAGPGHGFIDIYTNEGFLIKRLASRGTLNSPWGLAIAPDNFGPFGDRLLVGNFGDGRINVFGRFSGRFSGQLHDQSGNPIQIDDLWALKFGTQATGGTNTLLFSAGINDEKDGLVGAINAAG